MRKEKEAAGVDHVPAYFEEYQNPLDNQTYYVYNKKYFELDRKSQDWSKLPDLFGDEDDLEESNN